MRLRTLVMLSVLVLFSAWLLWPGTPSPPSDQRGRRSLDQIRERLAQTPPPIAPRSGPAPDPVAVAELPLLGVISGTVVGDPAGVIVIAKGPAGMQAVPVDPDGRFRMQTPPGRYTVIASPATGIQADESGPVRVDLERGEAHDIELILHDEPRGDPGLTVVESDDGFEVAWILPGGPASDLGLEEGDRILTVEGRDATALSIEEFERAMAGAEGSELALTMWFQDGGEGFVEDIELERSGQQEIWNGPT